MPLLRSPAALTLAVLATALALGVAVGLRYRSPPGAVSGRAPPGDTPAQRGSMTVHVAPPTARKDAAAGTPHVVLVIGCTVRKDQTSPYGGTATPFLGQLAASGVVVDDLIAAAPWTRAAATALLTGRHAISVGMTEPLSIPDDRILDNRVVTLAEHFQQHGFSTLGLTTNPNLNAVFGFDQGFDRYQELSHLWRTEGTKIPGIVAVADALTLVDAVAAERRPVYLQVVLVDAHAPIGADDATLAALHDPAVPAHIVRYRAGLRHLDDALAALDAGLRDRGFHEGNTLFVFVNDHGEGLSWPEHHGASHGRFLAPSAVGGVWVMRGPGLTPGHRLGGTVSGIDVASTIAGLAGLPPLLAGAVGEATGEDLSAVLRAGTPRVARGPVFSDTWFRQVDRAAIYTDTLACQVDHDTSAVGAKGEAQLPNERFVTGCFDRATDPLHRFPMEDDVALSTLRDWRAARAAEADAFGPVARAHVDQGTVDALRQLGYVD